MQHILQQAVIGFEKIYASRQRFPYIPGSSWEMLYVDIRTHRGRTIELPAGEIIRKGDRVAELHVNNLKLLDMNLNMTMVFRILRQEFEALARASQEHPDYQQIKAFYARTVLHPIAARQGWTMFDVANPLLKLFLDWWENTLRRSFSNEEGPLHALEPKECWISRKKLCSQSGGL